jgi:hypothetical protein
MKRYIDYLIESAEEKKYAFKIKIAGALPDNCEDVMETVLQQYKVSKFSKGKSTPIQASLRDFPTVKNSEMTVFEVELDYPTTSAVLTDVISNSTGITKDRLKVKTPLEEVAQEIEEEHLCSDSNEPVLTQAYPKENNQHLVGDKHVLSFLKDLAKQRKQSKVEQVKGFNDSLLAKKMHSEKAETMPAAGPARSLFGGTRKD